MKRNSASQSEFQDSSEDLSLLAFAEFHEIGRMILLDLEFMCWEESLRSGWSDPEKPPEVLEIGLAVYDLQREQVSDSFTSFVRPARNSDLSAYCLALLKVSQEDISSAPSLGEVLHRVAKWVERLGLAGLPTCSWGMNDRIFLTRDANRAACNDPFHAWPHVDLRSFYRLVLDHHSNNACDRDEVRAKLGLASNPNRHRALDDALDLSQYCRKLREFDGYKRG